MPKASAQKFHQSNGSQLDNALLALRKDSRVLRHRRAFADCFGANPVASALGDRTRRDPDAAMRTYHVGLKQTLKTGTFYLAGNRNFLFGSDNSRRGAVSNGGVEVRMRFRAALLLVAAGCVSGQTDRDSLNRGVEASRAPDMRTRWAHFSVPST